MEIMFKPFEKEDYFAYMGVEGEAEIARVTLPLDGKAMECEIVVDDNGINLDYVEEGNGETIVHDFQFELVAGQGKARAKHIFSLLALDNPAITIEDLMALGFIYNKV